MTARQPFTALCQQLARKPASARVDLHIHTTCSDGVYSPAEIVDLGRLAGLPALAITDHDTIDAIRPARLAAGPRLEVIAGVELTTQFRGRVLHLLGYFFHLKDSILCELLKRLRDDRIGRFWEMAKRLKNRGIALDPLTVQTQVEGNTPGRRHLAELLVKAGRAGTVREAFLRYLGDDGGVAVPHLELPVGEAIRVVRGAAGVAAWAHPSYDCTREALGELAKAGLQAIEVNFPSCRPGRARELRSWSKELGLAVTGGSDCHGPGNHLRTVGAAGISLQELENLRQLAISPYDKLTCTSLA